MKTIESINNRILHIEKIKRQKEAIANGLKIEWETDPKKMQFEKLRSYRGMERYFKKEILRVDQFNISGYLGSTPDMFGSDTSFVEMIDILMNGGKLISPAVTECYAMVDGQEKMVRSPDSLTDGCHRAGLAGFFGLDVIPVVVFKECGEYRFTPGKWNFEAEQIREEDQHGNWTEYPGVKATSTDGKVIAFQEYGLCIDSLNTDCLVICNVICPLN